MGLLDGILGGGGGQGGGGLLGSGGMVGGLMGDIGLNLSQIPFVGGMFPDPNAPAMQAAIKQAGQTYGAQRPITAQAYENLMNQVRAGYQPAQNALAAMYGGGGGPNLGGAPTSPPPPEGWTPWGAAGQAAGQNPVSASGQAAAGAMGGKSHGSSSPFGAFGDMLGLGTNAPFGLPGPGLMGAMGGQVMNNMPGFGWKGPAGMPGGQMLGGLPGMNAPTLMNGSQMNPSSGGLLGGLLGGGGGLFGGGGGQRQGGGGLLGGLLGGIL